MINIIEFNDKFTRFDLTNSQTLFLKCIYNLKFTLEESEYCKQKIKHQKIFPNVFDVVNCESRVLINAQNNKNTDINMLIMLYECMHLAFYLDSSEYPVFSNVGLNPAIVMFSSTDARWFYDDFANHSKNIFKCVELNCDYKKIQMRGKNKVDVWFISNTASIFGQHFFTSIVDSNFVENKNIELLYRLKSSSYHFYNETRKEITSKLIFNTCEGSKVDEELQNIMCKDKHAMKYRF